jgi:hypothetical protein
VVGVFSPSNLQQEVENVLVEVEVTVAVDNACGVYSSSAAGSFEYWAKFSSTGDTPS